MNQKDLQDAISKWERLNFPKPYSLLFSGQEEKSKTLENMLNGAQIVLHSGTEDERREKIFGVNVVPYSKHVARGKALLVDIDYKVLEIFSLN